MKTIDHTKLTDEQLAKNAEHANAEQTELAAEAERLETTATEARLAFESSPSAETLTTRDVQAQLAKNARSKADAHAQSIAPLLAEHSRRANAARAVQLRADIAEARAALDASADRIVEMYGEFLSGLRSQLAVVCRTLEHHNALVRDLGGAGHESGARPLNFGHALTTIRTRLEQKFGPHDSHFVHNRPGCHISLANTGNVQQFRAQVDFDPAIPHALRG